MKIYETIDSTNNLASFVKVIASLETFNISIYKIIALYVLICISQKLKVIENIIGAKWRRYERCYVALVQSVSCYR
jgi:hypothetical protein